MKSTRIEMLDYLRGVMALSVMAYHYVVWSGVELSSGSILSKLGIYAVSVFYILSGLSLTIVYRNRISTPREVGRFLIKRIFRIAPLFWLSVTASLFLGFASSLIKNEIFQFDVYKIFLNYSLLFGFIEPAAYLSTGSWSIGNEMVFYSIFPILFLISSRWPRVILFAVFVSVALGIIFAVTAFDSSRTLVDQWEIYINPFNQLFFFLGGVAIGSYASPGQKVGEAAPAIAVLAVLIFWLYPVSGDRLQLVSNLGRLVFSLTCFAFVWASYVTTIRFSGKVAGSMSFFGEGCYSIYLMHPLVAVPVVFLTNRFGMPLGWGYCMAAILTLVTSWLTFRYIENPMMRVGATVVSGLNEPRAIQA